MNTDDIARRAQTSYMLIVSQSTDEETRSNLNDFTEQHTTIDITVNEDSDEVRDIVESNVNQPEPMIVVHNYEQMDQDMQRFLAQYLKGVAEKHTDLPILVYDEEGGNLGMANPDLSGRVYTL